MKLWFEAEYFQKVWKWAFFIWNTLHIIQVVYVMFSAAMRKKQWGNVWKMDRAVCTDSLLVSWIWTQSLSLRYPPTINKTSKLSQPIGRLLERQAFNFDWLRVLIGGKIANEQMPHCDWCKYSQLETAKLYQWCCRSVAQLVVCYKLLVTDMLNKQAKHLVSCLF